MKKRDFKPFLSHAKKGEFILPIMEIQTRVSYKGDIEQIIKELGLPLISIELILPYCLHLEDGLYPIKVDNELYILKYSKRQRDTILYVGGTGTNIEMVNDPKGYFRHSCCEIFFKGGYYNTQRVENIDIKLIELINNLDYSLALKVNIEYLPFVSHKGLAEVEKIKFYNWNLPQLKNHITNSIKHLDEYGKVALYSKLLIVLDLKNVIGVLNRFVNVYRDVTKSFYLPNIKYTDIYNPVIHQFNIDRTYEMEHLFMLPNPFMLAIPDRTVEEHNKIWDILDNEKYSSVYNDLLSSAHRNICEENYSVSIIDANSAFEIFIEQLLFDKLKNNGLKDEDAEKYLKENNNWMITERVGSLFHKLFSIDLRKDDFYSKWYGVKILRDDIVHAGKRKIKETEAIKSLNVIENFIANILKKSQIGNVK